MRPLRPFSGLTPAAEARARLREIASVMGAERVPLSAAAGRVLANALKASAPMPAAPRALMDGYAVRAADLSGAGEGSPVRLQIAGAVQTGVMPAMTVTAGQAVEIATGGVVPGGADAVVAIEQTESSGGDVMVKVAIEAGRNLLPTGADIAAGRLLVPAGRRIGPREVTALASYGVVSVPVFARPRVAVLSSGAEVRPAHELPGPAGVRDSNQPMLAALAEAAGCQVTRAGLVADQPEALSAALAGLLGAHDVLILSAGTSVGRRDFALDAIASLPGARVLLHGLDIRPGKPTIAAVVEDGSRMRVLFGVPGFPVSAAVVFEAFVHDVLARMAGESGFRPWPVRVPVTMAAPHQSARGREDYLRVRFCDGPDRTGRRLVEPTPGGPANVSNFLDTDAVVIVAPETERLEAGQDVEAGLWG